MTLGKLPSLSEHQQPEGLLGATKTKIAMQVFVCKLRDYTIIIAEVTTAKQQ
jgi:hypothetical protein